MTAAEKFLFNRIKWVSFYRVIIAFFSLILIIYWKSKIEVVEQTGIFFQILIFIFILTILYAWLIRSNKNLRLIATFQVLVDLIIISLIVSYTGGIDSPLIFFYAFVIMEGGRFFGKNGAHIAMAMTVLFLGFVFFAQFNKYFPFNNLVYQRVYYFKEDFYYNFSVFSLGFLLLGLLVGYLSHETTKMHQEIIEQEARYYDLEFLKSAIVNSLNSGLIVFSKNGDITYANDTAKNLLKQVNDKFFNFIGNSFKDEILEVNKNSKIVRGEKKIPIDNKIYWIGYSIVPLYDHNRLPIGVLLNFQDITNIKNMEEQLRIKDKFSFMGKLSAFLAHEIRNPLASLKGGVEYIGEIKNLDEDHKKIIDIMTREIDRLNKIVTDFLYFTKISKPEKTNIYIKNLLDEIWFEIKMMNKDENRFQFFYDGRDDIILKGDPNQMRQVFLNLIINAIDAMKKNGGSGIYVKTFLDKDEIVITVEDEGGGIQEENINKIFDPFFSTKENGTGIGLSIVYRIIQEHDGDITVSNGERGAKFTLRFKNE
ncbi:MAG: ATP-binding protein [Proteobacteria bacterium]|nr:ATP-binding protein [Pseudomonadota bacterium]